MMTQLILDVPETLSNLPEPQRALLIRAGMYQAIEALVKQLKKEIAESKRHIRRFEARYKTSFAQFETEILPTLDTLQAHEDYNDWFFWQGVLTEKQNSLTQLQQTKQV